MAETIYAEIAVNIPQVSGLFHYHLPAELARQVVPGCLVTVPFGNRVVQGVVLRLLDRPEVAETRPVEGVLDTQPILTPRRWSWPAGFQKPTFRRWRPASAP